MRVVGYVRVSTGHQADEGVSLDAQAARIRAWAEANGAGGVAMYRDEGISGKNVRNRPGLEAALAAVGKGDALVCYSLTRLSRSNIDMQNIAKTLERRGADLVSLSEKIDTTSAAGKMVFRLLAVLAEFERDQISERTACALRYKKARGEHLGGSHTPFGYRAEGKRLVPAPDEQRAIRRAKEWRGRGMSLRFIAKRLEAQGVRRRAGGSKWCAVSVSRVLKYRA